jgi:integrase
MKVEIFRSKIRIRWTYLKDRYSLTVGDYTPENNRIAKTVIKQLKADIATKTFDVSLCSYRELKIKSISDRFHLQEYFTKWLLVFGNSIPYNVITTQIMIKKWQVKSPEEMPAILLKQSLAPNTFNCRLNILKRFVKWMVKKEIVANNPFDDIYRQKIKSKRDQRKPFQDYEIKLILNALLSNQYNRNSNYYFPFVKFMFMTGVRNAEAIGLQVKKINFNKKLITIDKVFARTRKGSYTKARIIKSTKTENIRYLPIGEEMEELLKPICEKKKPNDFVFTNVNGNPIDDHMFQKRVFKPMLKNLNIEERDLYACRHTFATLAIEQGLTPIQAGYLMGHSNPKTILQNYSHLRNIPDKLPSLNLR